MITGCNTNIRHRERIFHVQTEDSGRANPHIISHVYCGGTIVGSRKQDYSDAVELPDLDREVRSRIEQQHKAMLKALRRGEFDDAIAERLADRPGNATASEREVSGSSIRPTTAEGAGASAAPEGQAGSTTGSVTKPQIDADPSSLTEQPASPDKVARSSARPVFGESDEAQKPLDEVILEYLVEKARERSLGRRSPPKTRSQG